MVGVPVGVNNGGNRLAGNPVKLLFDLPGGIYAFRGINDDLAFICDNQDAISQGITYGHVNTPGNLFDPLFKAPGMLVQVLMGVGGGDVKLFLFRCAPGGKQ